LEITGYRCVMLATLLNAQFLLNLLSFDFVGQRRKNVEVVVRKLYHTKKSRGYRMTQASLMKTARVV
jgi:hypothetical protein